MLSLYFAAGLGEDSMELRQKGRNPEEKRTEETLAPPVHGKGPFIMMFEIFSLISFTRSLIFFAFARPIQARKNIFHGPLFAFSDPTSHLVEFPIANISLKKKNALYFTARSSDARPKVPVVQKSAEAGMNIYEFSLNYDLINLSN